MRSLVGSYHSPANGKGRCRSAEKQPTVINTEAATMTRCRPNAFAISVNKKQLATLHSKNRSMISAGSRPVALENAAGVRRRREADPVTYKR